MTFRTKTTSLKETLDVIEQELNKYKDLTRVELFNLCINNRLKAVLLKYNEQEDVTSNYLIRKGSARVLKTLTRMQKQDDKDVLETKMRKNKNNKNREESNYDN